MSSHNKIKRVGVIGAGPAGLVAAKSCLEAGLTPVIYESSHTVGGLWKAQFGDGTWQGMRTNLSKWSCMFSDFPWPETQTETFPTQKDVCRYLSEYAHHFGVASHIQFNTKVEQAHRTPEGWVLETTGTGDKRGEHDYTPVDYLISASGFFSSGDAPTLPGQKSFGGTICHSSQISDIGQLANQRVTVVGGSFSGCEIAAELARRGAEVTHVLRRSFWIASRIDPATQLPIDLLFYTRNPANSRTPEERNRLSAKFLEMCFGNPGNANHQLWIDPDSGAPNFLAISDGYLDLVREKKISIKIAEPVSYKADRLILDSHHRLEADTVVFATGFNSKLDYLSPELRHKLNFEAEDKLMPLPLHRATFPAALDTLAFVGYYRGPFFGVMEMQARWVAATLEGRVAMPSQELRAKSVAQGLELRHTRPRPQFPYSDYVGTMDSLAQEIDALPVPEEQTNPVVPSQYRLRGPHSDRETALQVIASLPKGLEP